jgi:uncharacterized protein YcfL
MRKLLFLSVIVAFILASCSSNPKSDAEKVCKCRENVLKKVVEIKGNRSFTDLSKEENDKIDNLVKECDEKEAKLKVKYKDDKAIEFKDALDACYDKVQKEYEGKLD